MENKSLLQPLLSNNDDNQIVDLQHPVVTTATNYQPPYVPNHFANVLNGMWMFQSTQINLFNFNPNLTEKKMGPDLFQICVRCLKTVVMPPWMP